MLHTIGAFSVLCITLLSLLARNCLDILQRTAAQTYSSAKWPRTLRLQTLMQIFKAEVRKESILPDDSKQERCVASLGLALKEGVCGLHLELNKPETSEQTTSTIDQLYNILFSFKASINKCRAKFEESLDDIFVSIKRCKIICNVPYNNNFYPSKIVMPFSCSERENKETTLQNAQAMLDSNESLSKEGLQLLLPKMSRKTRKLTAEAK